MVMYLDKVIQVSTVHVVRILVNYEYKIAILQALAAIATSLCACVYVCIYTYVQNMDTVKSLDNGHFGTS